MDVMPVLQLRSSRTDVNVVYTTPKATQAAVAAANSLAKDLDIRVRVLAFQVVPYPLDIHEPPVPPEFLLNRIAAQLKPSPGNPEFNIDCAACRDPQDALLRCLPTPSLVIIGGRPGIMRSREERIAHKLENMGHEVVFVPLIAHFRAARWLHRCCGAALRWFARRINESFAWWSCDRRPL
jgi:hypothetical protein